MFTWRVILDMLDICMPGVLRDSEHYMIKLFKTGPHLCDVSCVMCDFLQHDASSRGRVIERMVFLPLVRTGTSCVERGFLASYCIAASRVIRVLRAIWSSSSVQA